MTTDLRALIAEGRAHAADIHPWRPDMPAGLQRWLRANLAALLTGYESALDEVARINSQPMRLVDHLAAQHMADEIAVLVRRKVIDSRSPAADALLDYRNPPQSERSDRMVDLEQQLARMRGALATSTIYWRYPMLSSEEKACHDEIWSLAHGDAATSLSILRNQLEE